MTAEYLLKQMVDVGERMRTAQKGYFGTKVTDRPDVKREYLNESKKLEKQFDGLIIQVKQLIA